MVALGRESCRDTRHVLFGDSDIQETVGKFVGEGLDDREAEIAHHQEQPVIDAREVDQ